jgi:hypothetical protein
MKTKIIVIVAIVLAVGGLAFWLKKKATSTNKNGTTTQGDQKPIDTGNGGTGSGGTGTGGSGTGGTGTGPAEMVFDPQPIATALYEAMEPSGTDEDAIFRILQPLTGEQLLKVIAAFGSKQHPSWFVGSKNLIGWLKAELTSIDQEAVRKIFESKNINF